MYIYYIYIYYVYVDCVYTIYCTIIISQSYLLRRRLKHPIEWVKCGIGLFFGSVPQSAATDPKTSQCMQLSIFVRNIFFIIYNIIGGRHSENHACAHDIEKVNIIYYTIMFICIIGFVYKLALDTKHTSTKGQGECRTYLVLLFQTNKKSSHINKQNIPAT